jgi:copper homeostasis protein
MALKPSFLEIACFNYSSVIVAKDGGADRVELCTDKASGGVSPSLPMLIDARRAFTKPLFAMVRPRGGDFVYNEREFEQMKAEIIMFRPSVNGFVFGILDANNQVDQARNSELVDLAKPLSCTFHRAFDKAASLEKALEDVIKCGFKTILTSGGAVDAVTGAEATSKLIQRAQGRIIVMPGGGVRSSNIQTLKEKTRAEWYHSSAILDDDEYADVAEVQNLKEVSQVNND